DLETLAIRQPGDRLGERLAHLALHQLARRIGRVRILDRVDQRGALAAGGTARPQLVEGDDGGARDLGQALLELAHGDAELAGDLLVAGRALVAVLELGHRALDLARAVAHRARHPVQGAQLVDHRAADAGYREGLELDLAIDVETL